MEKKFKFSVEFEASSCLDCYFNRILQAEPELAGFYYCRHPKFQECDNRLNTKSLELGLIPKWCPAMETLQVESD